MAKCNKLNDGSPKTYLLRAYECVLFEKDRVCSVVIKLKDLEMRTSWLT